MFRVAGKKNSIGNYALHGWEKILSGTTANVVREKEKSFSKYAIYEWGEKCFSRDGGEGKGMESTSSLCGGENAVSD